MNIRFQRDKYTNSKLHVRTEPEGRARTMAKDGGKKAAKSMSLKHEPASEPLHSSNAALEGTDGGDKVDLLCGVRGTQNRNPIPKTVNRTPRRVCSR